MVVDGGYGFTGLFPAPTARGTWPAIWLTGANSWPPEIDIAEWKGSGNISFNSLGVQGPWSSYNVNYPDPECFHQVHVKVRDYNGADVQIKFFVDGALQTTQLGEGMVEQPFWL